MLSNVKQPGSMGPLGVPTGFSGRLDASLLHPLPRAPQRAEIGLSPSAAAPAAAMPFFGADLWTAYELSWLNTRGKPQIAIAYLTLPCESTNMVESKSLKLYLASFSSTVFDDAQAVAARIRADLGEAAWRVPAATAGARAPAGDADNNPEDNSNSNGDGNAPPSSASAPGGSIGVRLVPPAAFGREAIAALDGVNLDRLDVECNHYTPAPELLSAAHHEAPVTEVLTSDLLKSNCLVTGQPDWGSVQIAYSGAQIEQAGLLRYIVSFREHHEFHEHCVERIFMDVWRRCRPVKLAVYARYTRRGGIDINPWRTSHPQPLPPAIRTARQ